MIKIATRPCKCDILQTTRKVAQQTNDLRYRNAKDEIRRTPSQLKWVERLQGGTIGTPLLQGFYRAFIRNDRLSNKELVCNHEKATPSLRISDFSHPFLLSNLTISRNVQFPNKESLISTFNFRRPAARESGNWKFSEKLKKPKKLKKLKIFGSIFAGFP